MMTVTRSYINETISKFIKDNEESDLVIQLKKANESNDREGFTQLLMEIRQAMVIEHLITRNEQRILSHIESIKEIKEELREQRNALKNSMNYHKIKRGDNETSN
jgi:hypothetical protein